MKADKALTRLGLSVSHDYRNWHKDLQVTYKTYLSIQNLNFNILEKNQRSVKTSKRIHVETILF